MQHKFNEVFDRLKEAKLSENILCSEFWRKIISLHKKFNEADCWMLMTDNIEWLINSGIMTTSDIKSWFSEYELNEHNIFTTGNIRRVDKFTIGLGDVKIEASGHSRVILFDNAFCEAYDTTFVTGFQNSSFELKNCVGEAFGNCNFIARDFSKVEAWDETKGKSETYSFVIAHDNAQIESLDSSHFLFI